MEQFTLSVKATIADWEKINFFWVTEVKQPLDRIRVFWNCWFAWLNQPNFDPTSDTLLILQWPQILQQSRTWSVVWWNRGRYVMIMRILRVPIWTWGMSRWRLHQICCTTTLQIFRKWIHQLRALMSRIVLMSMTWANQQANQQPKLHNNLYPVHHQVKDSYDITHLGWKTFVSITLWQLCHRE